MEDDEDINDTDGPKTGNDHRSVIHPNDSPNRKRVRDVDINIMRKTQMENDGMCPHDEYGRPRSQARRCYEYHVWNDAKHQFLTVQLARQQEKERELSKRLEDCRAHGEILRKDLAEAEELKQKFIDACEGAKEFVERPVSYESYSMAWKNK